MFVGLDSPKVKYPMVEWHKDPTITGPIGNPSQLFAQCAIGNIATNEINANNDFLIDGKRRRMRKSTIFTSFAGNYKRSGVFDYRNFAK